MRKFVSLFFLIFLSASVTWSEADGRGSAPSSSQSSTNLGPSKVPTPSERIVTILALGDSLTEGYGVAKDQAYPALLEAKLNQNSTKQKTKYKVINAGVSGSTTASALGRLKWQLRSKPDYLLLALGANDGLRGLQVAESEKNLSQAVELAQKEGLTVILCGMMMPPNYGADYRREFQKLFERVAKKYKLIYLPFLLEGVAGEPSLNLADGIHPNEKGHEVMAENLYQFIKGKL